MTQLDPQASRLPATLPRQRRTIDTDARTVTPRQSRAAMNWTDDLTVQFRSARIADGFYRMED